MLNDLLIRLIISIFLQLLQLETENQRFFLVKSAALVRMKICFNFAYLISCLHYKVRYYWQAFILLLDKKSHQTLMIRPPIVPIFFIRQINLRAFDEGLPAIYKLIVISINTIMPISFLHG